MDNQNEDLTNLDVLPEMIDVSNKEDDTPYELNFRDIDRIILPTFMNLLNEKEIILEFKENNSIDVSYSKKALKWIKDVKRKDPHWDEEDFISRVIYVTAKMADNFSEEELEENILEVKKSEEENNVHKSDETTDISISN